MQKHRIMICLLSILILAGTTRPSSSPLINCDSTSIGGLDITPDIGDIVFSYDFSIRISYKNDLRIVEYAEIPMTLAVAENESMIEYIIDHGGFLESLSVPAYIESISLVLNVLGWGLLVNGTWKKLGGGWWWANHSTTGGWGVRDFSDYYKANFTRIMVGAVANNISINLIGNTEVAFDSTYEVNVSIASELLGLNWTHSVIAESTFPPEYSELNVESHVVTIFVDVSPPLDLSNIVLIALIGSSVVGVLASVYLYGRRKARTSKAINEDKIG